MALLRIFLLLLGLGLLSCGKDDPTPTPPAPQAKAPPLPFFQYESVRATLQATYRSKRVDSGMIGRITVFQGLGHAVFRDASGNLMAPSKIRLEGRQLSASQGIYRFLPQGSASGLDFGSEAEWEVTGQGNLPDFSESIAGGVPEIGRLNLEDTLYLDSIPILGIDLSSPYTRLGAIDSVIYRVAGPRNNLIFKTDDLNPVSLSLAQLQSLGRGQAYLQAEAFRLQDENYAGYPVRFVVKAVFDTGIWIK